jgi:hypothetical protein
MADKKKLLSISDPSVNRTKYGDFTRNYRQSSNVIDQRDNRGDFRARSDMFGRTGADSTNLREFYEQGGRGRTRDTGTSTRPQTSEIATPDDYSGGAAYGGMVSETTPNSTRKVDAEEAIRKTHFERM